MSNRISKAQVARLRELERQATPDNLRAWPEFESESRNLLPSLLDTLDEAMTALGHVYYELDQRGIVIDCKGSNCVRCERARALLAAWNKKEE